MSKLRRWGLSVATYQRGVWGLTFQSVTRTGWLKLLAGAIVIMTIQGVMTSDYFDVAGDSISEYGVKAATSAIGAATMVFVSMIRRDSRTRQFVDRSTQFISGSLALLAGWFWLLGETSGDPWPFLIAIAPFSLLFAALAFIILLIGLVGRAEDEYIVQRQTQELEQLLRELDPEQFQQVLDFIQEYRGRAQQEDDS